MTDSKKPETGGEIDCDEVMRQIFDYLDEEVDETVACELQAHIDDCRSCFSRVEFERVLKDRVRDSKVETLPESMQERITELMKNFSLDNTTKRES
ncbi:MAG: zf-HC2 domain-containing protein [Proteobacteria bacterium]|nr:zf-HC2 domain-containing protein [Pseudomonadota bacterium]